SEDFGPHVPKKMLLGLAVSSALNCSPSTITFDTLEIYTEPQIPPKACIETVPSSPVIYLDEDGKAEIALDGTCSEDGQGGKDLSYLWSRSASVRVTIESPGAARTRAVIEKRPTLPPPYKVNFTLKVKNSRRINNTASATVQVVVSAEAPALRFRRGDA